MGKTTNILDLNNRLEKVEKENVAQNNYNSLKNRPKINGNLLTGDKTGAQLGLAEALEVGSLSALTTTDKSSAVAAINEVNGKTSATHETVAPSSSFYAEDWYIDRIGDLRLLTITTVKDLASGYNRVAQLSSFDKPCREFFVRKVLINAASTELDDVTIRVRDDRYIDVIVNKAIPGTTYLRVVIPFTV